VDSIHGMGYRYGAAVERLKGKPASVELMSSALQAALQNGEYPTQYSNICDPVHGVVFVCLFHLQKAPVKLDLQTELRKGHHFYDLHALSEQLMQPLMTDEKTQPVASVDPAVYQGYVGRYRFQDDYLLTVSAEDGRLLVEAHDVSRTEVLPASSMKFFTRSLNAHMVFSNMIGGRAEDIMLYVAGRRNFGKRIE